MGYHKSIITKGQLGQASKIQEEYLEFIDAHEQGNKILELCELCDLIGAIEAYVSIFNLTLTDIIKMKEATKQAFQEGTRT